MPLFEFVSVTFSGMDCSHVDKKTVERNPPKVLTGGTIFANVSQDMQTHVRSETSSYTFFYKYVLDVIIRVSKHESVFKSLESQKTNPK